MEKDIIVPIPPETSLKIERLFYEYTAGRESVKFLMKDSDVRWDILQNYVNVVETRYTELEMLKAAVGKEYLPNAICLSREPYSFEFLFDQSAIRFSVEN